jgi:hypothetical protein
MNLTFYRKAIQGIKRYTCGAKVAFFDAISVKNALLCAVGFIF